MGKKKFSRDDDDDNTTDDETQNGGQGGGPTSSSSPACPHVGKAVNISELKKALKVAWVRIGKCGPCERDKKTDSSQKMRLQNGGPNDGKKKSAASSKKSVSAPPVAPVSTMPKINVDPSIPVDIWLCLRCAGQSCSPKVTPPIPSLVSHATQHFETPRSDLHCVVLNVDTWTLWCFECKAELYLDSYKKLHEAVDHVKRVATTKSVSATTPNTVVKKDFSISSAAAKTLPATTGNSVLPRARGLNNLGNTCFFNAVMQCLSATHPFVRFLDTHCQKGAPLNTPAVYVPAKVCQRDDSGLGNSSESTQSTIDDSEPETLQEETRLDPLSLQLAEAGSITLAVAAFFKEMHSVGTAKVGPVNPGHLFGQICRRSPQFRGFQQQDAHELLRHLMDGLRSEEIRRQRTAILKHFGLTEKSDPKKVDDKIRRKVSALSKHSTYTIVDRIFGGHLVSTIVCEQCHNSSQIYEPFLDLSLPLIDQKPPRPGGSATKNNRSSNVSHNGGSLDVDGDDAVDISCFGRNKKKSEEGDEEPEGDFTKSKHQMKKEKAKAKKEKRRNKNRNKNIGSGDINEDPASDVEQPDKEVVECSPDQKDGKEVECSLDQKVGKEVECSPDQQAGEFKPETDETKPIDPDCKGDASEDLVNPDVNLAVEPALEPEKVGEQGLQIDEPTVRDLTPDVLVELKLEVNNDCDQEEENTNVMIVEDEDKTVGNVVDVVVDDATILAETKLTLSDGEESKIKKELEENGKKVPTKKKSPNKPVKSNKKSSKNKKGNKNASEEEDEDDGYSEEAEDDWEWDYGEQWDEKEGEKEKEEKDQDSDYLEVNDLDDKAVEEPQIKQSLNPLPPEMLERGSSEREKSSEPIPVVSDEEEDETGASINGDVEDNLDETTTHASGAQVSMTTINPPMTDEFNSTREASFTDPYCPDSNHLDPHMEALCRRVRKLSVASSNVIQDDTSSNIELVDKNYDDKEASKERDDEVNSLEAEEEMKLVKLRQDWIARSLTSVAPRYHSRAGECSIYSSLSQFTAPELLTGSNRWACDRCTYLASRLRPDNDDQSDSGNDEEADDKKKKKAPTVYSNASKQLLLFSPPAVLTIHLKRFQQTMSGLRKDNRHVEFPMTLNLAPFLSTTSLSTSNIVAGSQEINYVLFGIVEHSGGLRGGHYTAFVKVRPALSANFGARFHSEPTSRSDDIVFLMSEIERKCRETTGSDVNATESVSSSDIPASKWYHISDSSVVEVSEERVLKSQAYLLFYERIQ